MIAVDWITSSYPYLPRSPERTEGWKDINLISEHGNYPTSATRSPCRTRNLCFVARQFRLCDISALSSSAWFCSNCGCFSCSQVTNHSSRDKMLVFNQTVLLCSNFVCSCRLICWMMLRLLSSCRARALLRTGRGKNQQEWVSICVNFILQKSFMQKSQSVKDTVCGAWAGACSSQVSPCSS